MSVVARSRALVDLLYTTLADTNRRAPLTLYSTVADHDGNLGLVVGPSMVVTDDWSLVAVEWDHGKRVEDTRDLLTDYDRCTHGGPAGSPDRCDMDTAPGHEHCEAHGGASPIAIRVVRA